MYLPLSMDLTFCFVAYQPDLGQKFHIFKPQGMSADDTEFPAHVLLQQARYFGHFPLSYKTLLNEDQEKTLAAIHIYI